MGMLLGMFYTCNLRYFVTLPKYEPEINTDLDAEKYAHGIIVAVPEKIKGIWFDFIKDLSTSLHAKVWLWATNKLPT